jgi:hypothetical protein
MTFEQQLEKLLQTYLPLLPQMSREQLLSLGALVRQFRINLMGMGPMPASAIEEMAKITPDALVRDIVNDSRRGVSAPSGLLPDETKAPAPVRGSGWQSPKPLEGPPGVKICDQIADHFAALDREQMIADAIDRVRKIKG